MKYKDLIIKTVASIICIGVMSVIIFLVYNYYSNKALNGDNSHNSSDTNTNTTVDNNEVDNNDNNNDGSIHFKKFNNIKTYLDEFDSKVVMTYVETDAGNILLINDNSIVSYSINDTVTYGVLEDAIVIRISTKYEGDTLVFADKDGNVFKIYSLINNNKYNLYIMNSIMTSKDDSIEFDGKIFTITWRVQQDGTSIVLSNEELLEANSNIFNNKTYRKGDIVEYTMEIEYLGNKRFTEAKTLEEFNLDDYVKKFA